jgi:hypothetical protein
MTCEQCGLRLGTLESRNLETEEGIKFTRRVKECANKHKIVTHEIKMECSPIPDIYRIQRTRKIKPKSKKQKKKTNDWLKKIEAKLNEL